MMETFVISVYFVTIILLQSKQKIGKISRISRISLNSAPNSGHTRKLTIYREKTLLLAALLLRPQISTIGWCVKQSLPFPLLRVARQAARKQRKSQRPQRANISLRPLAFFASWRELKLTHGPPWAISTRMRWPMRRGRSFVVVTSIMASRVRTSLNWKGSWMMLRRCVYQSEILLTLPVHW